jgi:hypothetical protein
VYSFDAGTRSLRDVVFIMTSFLFCPDVENELGME